MKKILYLFVCFLLPGIQSCVQDDKDIFGKPAAERLSEILENYREILTGATNGWSMEYYPKNDRSYGGYTVLLTFRNDEVDIASEIFPEKTTSLWSLKEDTGPVLSFDTYNKAFHFFSEPAVPGLEGKGYEGDYEFVFMGVENGEVILKGKKTGNLFRMHPLPEAQSWQEALASLREMMQLITPPEDYGYEMILEGSKVLLNQTGRALMPGTIGRNLEIDYATDSDTVTTTVPFIYTFTGMKFYQPVTINGKEVQFFAWSEIERTLICTDEGVDARISIVPSPMNKMYAYSSKNWYFSTSAMSTTFKEGWQQSQQLTKESQGLRIYQIYLTYDPGYGGQVLRVVLTDESYLYDCLLLIHFRPVKWTDEEIEIEVSGPIDNNGEAFYGSCGGEELSKMMNGRYKLIYNESADSRTFLFLPQDERDMWFQLTTEETYLPVNL